MTEALAVESNLVKLRAIAQRASLSQLRHFSQVPELQAAEIAFGEEKPIIEYWRTMVLVSCSPVRLTLTIRFSMLEAASLASATYLKSPCDLKETQIVDFVKEYCNLTAGEIKRSLESDRLQVGLSLPLLMQGIDKMGTAQADGESLRSHEWSLVGKDIRLTCSMLSQVLDEEAFAALFINDEEIESGQITFL